MEAFHSASRYIICWTPPIDPTFLNIDATNHHSFPPQKHSDIDFFHINDIINTYYLFFYLLTKRGIFVNIIVAGNGKVGSTLTRQLSAEGYDLTLIDSNPKILESTVELCDVMVYEGNAASMSVLRHAGIKEADLLIAAAGADEVNLLCCATAHRMNPNLHTIARIRNPEYAEQIYSMREIFALSMIVNPERQAAAEIARLLQFPGFLKRDSFAKGRIEIVELKIEPNSKLCDVALSDLGNIIKCSVLVCMVARGSVAFVPDGQFILRANDRIFVTAPTNNLALLLKNIGIITKRSDSVMIVGGGGISYYLAQQLEKTGIYVKIIEKDYERCRHLATLLPNIEIVHGDASHKATLESERIDKFDSLVTATGMDEMNMMISLYGHTLGVPQIITKISHVYSDEIIHNLPVGSVVCPTTLCTNSIVRYVRAMRNQTGAALSVHTIADGHAEATEFSVDANTLHCGEPLKTLKTKKNVLIVSITRAGRTEIPNGNSSFHRGDIVVIVSTGDTLIYQLNDIFDD